MAALTTDASLITSITATSGTVTVGTGVFSADAAALNKIVGGFAISDTAANIQTNLAALTTDASHIASITATSGTVTVGTGVFVADAAALNKIVGGFAISDTAANIQTNLAALATAQRRGGCWRLQWFSTGLTARAQPRPAAWIAKPCATGCIVTTRQAERGPGPFPKTRFENNSAPPHFQKTAKALRCCC